MIWIWIIFGCVVVGMICAGMLISRLAEISERERGKKSWIWGVVIMIALVVIPLLLLGIIVKFFQYTELRNVFESFRR